MPAKSTKPKTNRKTAIAIAGQLLALGRGANPGPLPADGSLTLRRSRSKTPGTEGVYYLDGITTGLRESENAVALTLHEATQAASVSEKIGHAHPDSLKLEAIVRAKIGIEPPKIMGEAAHDVWQANLQKGTILLGAIGRVLDDGATLGQLDDEAVTQIWRDLGKTPIPKRKKKEKAGGETPGGAKPKAKSEAPKRKKEETPKTYSYTQIQRCLTWLRGAIYTYKKERGIGERPQIKVPHEKVRRNEFLLRSEVADMIWAARGRLRNPNGFIRIDEETGKPKKINWWIRETVTIDGKEVETGRNYIDHQLKEAAAASSARSSSWSTAARERRPARTWSGACTRPRAISIPMPASSGGPATARPRPTRTTSRRRSSSIGFGSTRGGGRKPTAGTATST